MPSRTLQKVGQRVKSNPTVSSPRKLTPALISSIATTAADTIQITFSTNVITGKLPSYTAGAANDETVASMTWISATVIELTFTGDVQGTTMIVAEGDPGIRTMAGGFVPAGSYPVPTFP